jgi:ribosomal protein L37E
MASAGWLCRRVGCGMRNEPRKKKCFSCGSPRLKKRVPPHKKALRDVPYETYIILNRDVHHLGEVCAVCGKERSQDRRLDRDHDHTTGQPWSGKPRGLVCVGCNILMPPKMTAGKAREIASYLTRVEDFYSDEETLLALQKLQEDAA